MTTNQNQGQSAAPNSNSTSPTSGATPPGNSQKSQNASPSKGTPSQKAIAEKAYAIWLSRGQEQGHEQQHWLEAERQLKRA